MGVFVKSLISEKKFREEILGQSPSTYWRLKKAGELPDYLLVGKKIFYTEQSIEEWILRKTKVTSPGIQ